MTGARLFVPKLRIGSPTGMRAVEQTALPQTMPEDRQHRQLVRTLERVVGHPCALKAHPEGELLAVPKIEKIRQLSLG